MLSHENIWHAIDRLAATFGYSPSGLAKQAGLDPTAFNKSKRVSSDGKPRWPSTESISRILAATGATMSDFLSLIDSDNEISAVTHLPRHIPLIGFAQAGNDGYFDEDGYPAGDAWDEVRFPELDVHEDERIYALEVNGNSMEPLYREGDVLIVSPSTQIRRGDRIVVKTANGEVLAKELIRQSASKIELKSLNPKFEDRSLSQNEISWCVRILWISQ